MLGNLQGIRKHELIIDFNYYILELGACFTAAAHSNVYTEWCFLLFKDGLFWAMVTFRHYHEMLCYACGTHLAVRVLNPEMDT